MDDNKKKLQEALLKSLGGGVPDMPVPPSSPSLPSQQPPRQGPKPLVDPEAASQAQRSMRRSFGGDEDTQSQLSPEELSKLSVDLDRILGIKQQSPEEQKQNDELLRQFQLEYLRKKSAGQ